MSTQQTITVRRLIKAERSIVFGAFSSAESLTQWFSPSADISIELLEYEFTAQGTFRVRYSMSDGSQPVVAGRYELIRKPEEIAFTWIWEAPDPHADIETHVHVHFNEQGEYTEVVLTHDKLPGASGQRHSLGWEATLDRLGPMLILSTMPNGATQHA